MKQLSNSWWRRQLLYLAALLTLVLAPVARPSASCGFGSGGACSQQTGCQNICSCQVFNQYVINCGDCWWSQQGLYEEAYIYVESAEEGCNFPVYCDFLTAADCLQ